MKMEDVSMREGREGKIAKGIETQTSKVPSDVFLWTAIGTLAASALLQFGFVERKALGFRELGLFVGQLAPTILIMGLYNKLVKVAGHDRTDTQFTH